MIDQKGFTLIEWLLVMMLIAIVGATASPLFVQHNDFRDRFFLDEMLGMLRYGNQVTKSTGCEIKVDYQDEKQIALLMRQHCNKGEFTKVIASPGFIIDVPRNVGVIENLPIYIDKDGKIYDKAHQWQQQYILKIKSQQLVIDGFSGFAYEKN